MADLNELAEKRTAVLWLDPNILKIQDGLNARLMDHPDTIAHIEDLAASIAVEGVRKPLEVFGDGDDVFVADGHCRLLATFLANSRGAAVLTVPCVREAKKTNDVVRRLNQIVSNSGKPFGILEAGRAIGYALAKGWTVEEVAAKLGKSLSYVRQAYDFQGAPAEVHAHVRAGEISASTAAIVVRNEGERAPEVIKAAVETAKASGKAKATARELRPLLREPKAMVRPEPLRASQKSTPLNPPIVPISFADFDIQTPSSLARELNVTIKGTVFHASREVWTHFADELLAVA